MRLLSLAMLAGGLALNASPSSAKDTFTPLQMFSSGGGQLSLKMTAKQVAGPLPIGNYQVTNAMVFQTCKTGVPKGKQVCSTPQQEYAGPRLQVRPGQSLHINFTNGLAKAGSAQHCMDAPTDSAGNLLTGGLANLHTHGLLVSPHARDAKGEYGDYVVDCSQAGASKGAAGIVGESMVYNIKIPQDKKGVVGGENHPSGLNWIHPHVHGGAKVEVSSGLAGMITVGKLADYVCLSVDKGKCVRRFQPGLYPIRHMLLKDAQMLKQSGSTTWEMYGNQDPKFCNETFSNANSNAECVLSPPPDGDTYATKTLLEGGDGRWIFTINGVQKPNLELSPAVGEVWRIQNASANVTYDLSLQVPTGAGVDKIPFQVITMDGAGFHSAAKQPAPQPGAPSAPVFVSPDHLQTDVYLMPGSRIEIFVQYRDPKGCADADFVVTDPRCKPQVLKAPVVAELVNTSFATGGDNWPAVQLASISFGASKMAQPTEVNIASLSPPEPSPTKVAGRSNSRAKPKVVSADKGCLFNHAYQLSYADGNDRRRVYFAIMPSDPGINRPEEFLLGTSIVTKVNGLEAEYVDTPTGLRRVNYAAVGDAENRVTLRAFPMDEMGNIDKILCVPQPKDAQKTGYVERWELINLSTEVHNFHIHQSKFTIARANTASAGNGVPLFKSYGDEQSFFETITSAASQTVLTQHDVIVVPRALEVPSCDVATNYKPLGPGQGYLLGPDPTAANKTPQCVGPVGVDFSAPDFTWDSTGMITIDIPFGRKSQQGLFVYHCHILEHEDKGMMAPIRVLAPDEYSDPPPQTATLQ